MIHGDAVGGNWLAAPLLRFSSPFFCSIKSSVSFGCFRSCRVDSRPAALTANHGARVAQRLEREIGVHAREHRSSTMPRLPTAETPTFGAPRMLCIESVVTRRGGATPTGYMQPHDRDDKRVRFETLLDNSGTGEISEITTARRLCIEAALQMPVFCCQRNRF